MSLVGHWPLTDWTGDASDLSGQGNDGTVNGATQGVWGPMGITSYSFDGSDDDISNVGLPSNLSACTISFWAWPRSFTDTTWMRFRTNNAMQFSYDTNNSEIDFRIFNGSSWTTIDYANPNTDEWHHWVGVWDGNTMQFWRDASLIGTASESTNDNNSNTSFIGSNGSAYFDGYMADVRVYDYAIGPRSIEELYDWGSGSYTNQTLHDGTDPGAISRWFAGTDVTADSWGSNTLTDNTSAGTSSDSVDGGNAKSFDGTDDYMNPGNLGLSSSNSFSISAWINMTSLGGAIVSRYDGSDDIMDFHIASGKLRWELGHAGGNELFPEYTFNPTTDTWYHTSAVYDSNANSASLYLNGVKVEEVSGSIDDFDTTNPPLLGKRTDDIRYLEGELDDIRIFNRALSAHEIAQIYRTHPGGRDGRQLTVIQ